MSMLRAFREAVETPVQDVSSALFVTAHPDDEVMFFAPTIQALAEAGITITLLCLSTGNADGMGRIREKEVAESVKKLKISYLLVIDDPLLQDGMYSEWDLSVVEKHVHATVLKYGCKLIFTFDCRGVSMHRNHCDVHLGVRKFHQRKDDEHFNVRIMQLVTVSIWRKYTGFLEVLLVAAMVIIMRRHDQTQQRFCYITRSLRNCHDAMKCHGSQLVWYRRIYLWVSCYMYLNCWSPMID